MRPPFDNTTRWPAVPDESSQAKAKQGVGHGRKKGRRSCEGACGFGCEARKGEEEMMPEEGYDPGPDSDEDETEWG